MNCPLTSSLPEEACLDFLSKHPDGNLPEAFKLLSRFYHVTVAGQKRKWTGEDYVIHTEAVAARVSFLGPVAEAAGHGHDLIEDIFFIEGKAQEVLWREASRLKVSSREFYAVFQLIIELTNVYRPENAPGYNRAARKALEATRLSMVSPTAKSIKLADVANNASSIFLGGPGFARKWVAEGRNLLTALKGGDEALHREAADALDHCFERISRTD